VRIVIVSGIIFSTASLFYFYIIQSNTLSTRFGTGFTNSAICEMGIITVFAFILSLGEIKQSQNKTIKWLLIIGLIPLLSASLLTQSRGTILSIITATLVIGLFKKRRFPFVIIVCVLLFLGLSTPLQDRLKNSKHYDDRISLYLYSIEIIKDYPIVGTGFSIDTFRNTDLVDSQKYKNRIPERYRAYPMLWPHNMFLSICVRTGIIGLATYCVLLISFVRLAAHLIKFGKESFIQTNAISTLSSFTMFCTIGFFTPIFTHFADFTFFTIFSMLSILWQLDKKIS
jgi:O-antigen ligase